MPFYEVEHCIPLTKDQRDDLAKAITHIHSRKFTTPSLFVNIRFTNSSEHCNYVAGKEVQKYPDADKREILADCLQCAINRVIAHVRAGGSRTKEDFDDLTRQILDAWNQIVKPDGSREKELKRVFVIGAITAGMESGFFLPKAGEDGNWLKENMPKFEELAMQGDLDFFELVEEMRSREDL